MRLPRSSGVLLHITSLPGPHGSGDLGEGARHFVDWLQTGGQRLWQVLPLGGVGLGNSPYMSSSAFAGNVLMIDLQELAGRGWLTAEEVAPVAGMLDRTVAFPVVVPYRMARLALAAERFRAQATPAERAAFLAFCREQVSWLGDYALFMALAEREGAGDWNEWAPPLVLREPEALAQAAADHTGRLEFWRFCQWTFFRQWRDLRAYANARGVRIVGDMPIFMAYQSAEVWARPELFELNAQGLPDVVAGVPPDFFSATGQRWGNPLYRWRAHQAEGFAWWIARIRSTFELVDIVRIDHFRGFEAYWEIPATEPTAVRGRWVPAPGDALFRAVTAALGPQAIIAEDLGVITPGVEQLRRDHDFPGMRVLQFAWGEDGSGEPKFLPHHHTTDSVVYSGTHDNDTTVGWWRGATPTIRRHVHDYLATSAQDIAWDMIRAACASVGDLAIYPMQDVLRLGSEHRMNVPGHAEGHWGWRFSWQDVHAGHAQDLYRMAQLYGRLTS